jgi:hypothetical protein
VTGNRLGIGQVKTLKLIGFVDITPTVTEARQRKWSVNVCIFPLLLRVLCTETNLFARKAGAENTQNPFSRKSDSKN